MVLQVVGEMRQITFLADDRLLVGAGVSNVVLAHRALDHGLSGMEFAEGIPGTVGASVRLNAGAYDQSFGDSLLRALVVSPRGAGWRERDEINPTYRDTNLQATEVVAQIEVQLTRNSREKIASRMQELADRRARTQPIKARTFGSVFVNPGEELGHPALPPAWNLIADVVELIALARQRVHAESGIVLKPEIVFFGDIGLPPIR